MSKKECKTVIDDISELLTGVINGKDVEVSDEFLAEFGGSVAVALKNALTARTNKTRKTKTLYMSEWGRPCRRQLWYDIRPEYKVDKEKISSSNLVKFLYGDILEELVLALATLAGHEVTDQQKSCEIDLPNGWKLRGRMDGKIDGEVMDVKSTTSFGFAKFKKGTLAQDDPFGYIDQLGGYVEAENPSGIPAGTKSSFIVIDKQLGHLCRMEIEKDVDASPQDIEDKRLEFVMDLESSKPPERHFKDKPEGKAGNMRLDTGCSYCGYKEECWKDCNDGKGLRTFLYSNGPKFMTTVVKEPNVMEKTD